MKNEEALKKLWRETIHGEHITVDQERLFASLRQKSQRFEKKILLRDITETLVGIVLFFVFAISAVYVPSLTGKIGAGIIACSMALIIYKLHRAKQLNLPNEPTLMQLLLYEKEKVDKQIALLTTVWAWYLLPPLTGILVFFNSFPLSVKIKVLYSSFCVILYLLIYTLNQRAVKKELLPLRAEIDEKLQILHETSNPDKSE